MSKTFEVEMPPKSFNEGWGVYFDAIWDEDSDKVSEIIGGIVRIDKDHVEMFGSIPCVLDENGTGRPIENFKELEPLGVDDTHDFRDRFFEFEEDAKEHLKDTMDRWKHPQVWESFVTFG